MQWHRKCNFVALTTELTHLTGVLVFLLCLFTLPTFVSGQLVELHLRIEWGGPQPVHWRGEIELNQGVFRDVQPLGMAPDVPGSFVVQGSHLLVAPKAARLYDGLDVVVQAPVDASLRVALSPKSGAGELTLREFSLADIRDGQQRAQLDGAGSQIIITRVPGDRLRFNFERSNLVFDAGEEFQLELTPYEVDLPRNHSCELQLKLIDAVSGSVVWSERKETETDDNGAVGAQPWSIKLPSTSGVYNLHATLEDKRYALVPRQLISGTTYCQSRAQLVVIGSVNNDVGGNWAEVGVVDPLNPASRWQWLMRSIPGFDDAPLQAGAVGEHTAHGKEYLELNGPAWHAVALSTPAVDRPHLIIVEYPTDREQSLGISLIEPNQAGKVEPLTLDSGVTVPRPVAGQETSGGEHYFVVWPKTTTPLLLFTNLSDDSPAAFGKIRVLAGPNRLPAANGHASTAEERLLVAHYTRPFFPENFGAREAFDESRSGTFVDWKTYFDGSQRLIEYMRYAGYNAAAINVFSEGSSIYPSRLLESTPQHDTGTFFATGQDPIRKDVVEMLFRRFDRAGLKLIPTFELSSHIPELERWVRQGASQPPGILLVDSAGRPWAPTKESVGIHAPRYNPLDPRVQNAIRRVIVEFVERYAHHPSFAGITLQLGPKCYTSLPAMDAGLDPTTLQRFATDVGAKTTDDSGAELALPKFALGEGRQAWLNWRSYTLGGLYAQIHQDIARRQPNGKLFLATDDLFYSADLQSAGVPSLPTRFDPHAFMLQFAIDPSLFARNDGVVMLRPRLTGPSLSLHDQAADLSIDELTAVDKYFDRGKVTGTSIRCRRVTRRLSTFEALSPFGTENTHLRLESHLSLSEMHARREFIDSLARADSQVLFHGGWMLPLGHEKSSTAIYQAYRRLPGGKFEDVRGTTVGTASSAVTLRTMHRGVKTYFYLVNNSPWPASVDIDLSVPADCGLVPLDDRPRAKLVAGNGVSTWSVQLEPYDLVGAVLTSSQAKILDWVANYDDGLEKDVAPVIQQQVREVLTRANLLRRPQPTALLANPSFEGVSENGIDDWLIASAPGIEIAVDDREPRHGRFALRMARGAPTTEEPAHAWIRSEPIKMPKTGRLAVLVWLRTSERNPKPKLRIAIEGRLNDAVYYRYFEVGSDRSQQPVGTRWERPYLFPFENVPVSELSELRVGFDLMGPGEVWIDDIQIYDLWFHDHERQTLVREIGQADLDLAEGDIAGCYRFLSGFWPRFLLTHVPASPHRVADLRAAPGPAKTDEPKPAAEVEEPPAKPEPSRWERWKDGATGWWRKIW